MAQIEEDEVEAVAIALLNAYADDVHERRVEEIVRSVLGTGVYVTRSSEILPEIREYERTSTTVVNAYVGPAITRYLGSLVDRLRAAGIEARLDVMQSSGGTLTPETAARRPAHLIESGPAAGVMACAYLGRLTGRPRLISLDMGGTTAKAAIVEDGLPVRTSEYEVGAGINLSSKLVKGGGHPIKLPFIDVSEIGAGGGSIVSVDPVGSVAVGPVSAGSVPGPVCYGTGGVDPTLTDALVVLGYLGARELGGGAITLDPATARDAIDRVVATPLRRSVEEAAHGVLQLAVATMTRAVKAVTTYRGRDPRDFTLCAFGGNGPLTGVDVARALGIGQVLVPPAPGVFSALGLLFSDTEHEVVRTLMLRGDEITAERLQSELAALEDEATAHLDGRLGHGRPLRGRPLLGAGVRAHDPGAGGRERRRAGRGRLRRRARPHVRARLRRRPGRHRLPPCHRTPRADRRPALRPARRDSRPAPRREHPPRVLRPGARHGRDAGLRPSRPARRRAAGPLLVDEIDSTCVVPPNCVARLDGHGNIEVDAGV